MKEYMGLYKFKIDVDFGGEVEVEIPQSLHDKVCREVDSKGNPMARMEFGFHFPETVERDFPELHELIMQAINRELVIDNKMMWYSLITDWFEEEL